MGEEQKEPMNIEKRRDFVGKLFDKLAFVKSIGNSGKNVEVAESAVEQQIRDTVIKGDPQKT